ncbi:M16 family metallopeptidase [Arenimonas composti]|uniref:Peptidase M16 C-terminal domain-containing protein n=1 Tax=Arenimonas composti TR7-09 = DSM 18010 TaxID=1121013 RepID=A0A091BEE4_9GAMM|nr:pitrilysin family protein [Arenimonas composti]KFN49189.1 hypothetical protein P873_12090 [Arenimonas composti TR7-09 = DSM 18010]
MRLAFNPLHLALAAALAATAGLAPAAQAVTPALAAAAVPGDVTLPTPQRATLANGIELLIVEKRDTPLVAIDIAIRGGALGDPAGREGTANLLAELLQKGAGSRDALQFAEAIDGAGATLSTYAGTEAMGLTGSFLREDVDLMVELASDALLRPRLDAEEFERLRTRSIQALAAARDSDPGELRGAYGYAALFAGHPYGRPESGDETTLAAITLDDVKRYYADHVGADRMVIAIVGDVDAAQLRTRLERAFGGFRAAAAEVPTVQPLPAREGRRVVLVDKPGAAQTYFWLGNVGVARGDEGDAAQELVNTVFGGRFTSMLNTELRIKSGLSYGAGSSLQRLKVPGATAISSFTRTDATEQALDLALATLDRLHADGISPEMLASARNYVLGQFPPDLETNGQIADALTDLWLYGLEADAIDAFAERVAAVDDDALRAAIARAYPTSDDLVMVLIGDAAKIREVAKKYGAVTEMKITDPRFSGGQ